MSYRPSKYFDQRYRYFMKYGHGIRLDEEAWFSVTPEAISEHQAKRCSVLLPVNQNGRCSVLDAFCGIGGNSISFANSGYLVVACDLDLTKLRKVGP
jgi:trimethylguanosine synthase